MDKQTETNAFTMLLAYKGLFNRTRAPWRILLLVLIAHRNGWEARAREGSGVQINLEGDPDAYHSRRDDASDVRTEFHRTLQQAIQGGSREHAIDRGLIYYDVLRTDPSYLVDMGTIAYWSGRHALAMRLCNEASIILATQLRTSSQSLEDPSDAAKRTDGDGHLQGSVSWSLLAHACRGSAASYMREEDIAIDSLLTARRLRESLPTNWKSPSRFFTVTQSDLEHNILSTLGGFQRYAQCSHNLYEYLKMPVNAVKAAPSVAAQTATYTSHSYTDTLVWIALLSQIEWDSTFGARTIQALDNELHLGSILWKSIRRVQSEHLDTVSVGLGCLHEERPATVGSVLEWVRTHFDSKAKRSDQDLYLAIKNKNCQLMKSVNDVLGKDSLLSMASCFGGENLSDACSISTSDMQLLDSSNPKCVLISQYYSVDNATTTDRDVGRNGVGGSERAPIPAIRVALVQNLLNDAIATVVLFTDAPGYDFSWLPPLLLRKLIIIDPAPHEDARLTFQRAFDFSNSYAMGRTVIIANSDIAFDASLYRLGDAASLDLHGCVLALAKWIGTVRSTGPPHDGRDKPSGNCEYMLPLQVNSQDAWIFQSPISAAVVEQSNFYLGAPRCDNVLAHILESSGHCVYSPAFAIHAYEVPNHPWQSVSNRAMYGTGDAVLGPSRFVALSDRLVF